MADEYRGWRFSDAVTTATITTYLRTATEYVDGQPTGRTGQSSIAVSSADSPRLQAAKLAVLQTSMEQAIDQQLDAPPAQG